MPLLLAGHDRSSLRAADGVRIGHLRGPTLLGTMMSMDERDVTLLMEVLFDIRSRIVDIHEEMLPPEDDDGQAEEEEDA
jgi:hypothetical protein